MRNLCLKNERGIAMMMTLVTMLLLSILAAELVYQNQVYTGIVFRQRDQLRARLLARSAMRLGLLQLRATEKAKAQIKSLGLGDESLANQIWQTPLLLPPPAIPGMTQVDTQSLETFKKSLGLDGSLAVTIVGESDRLDLMQLIRTTGAQSSQSDPSKPKPIPSASTGPAAKVDPEQIKQAREKLRKSYAEVLDAAFEKKRQDSEDFRNKYPSLKADTLLLNLVAFMDPETKTDGDNRDKGEYYKESQPPYAPKNAPLTSVSELHMVKGFDDTITDILMSLFTLQPATSLNVNRASAALLQALIPELTNDDTERLLKRRDDTAAGGNFKTADEFWTYLNTLNNYDDAKKRLQENGLNILGTETSYRVIATSDSGAVHKRWEAAMGTMLPLSDADKAEAAQIAQQAGATTPNTQPAETPKSLDGEQKPEAKNSSDSLRIIYLKAD